MEKRKEEVNHIKVQLEKNGVLNEEVVLSRDAHIKIYRKNGSIETKEVDTFPLFTSFFPSCNSFSKDIYKISVKEIYMENGIKKENTLIDSAPVEWEQDKDSKALRGSV